MLMKQQVKMFLKILALNVARLNLQPKLFKNTYEVAQF